MLVPVLLRDPWGGRTGNQKFKKIYFEYSSWFHPLVFYGSGYGSGCRSDSDAGLWLWLWLWRWSVALAVRFCSIPIEMELELFQNLPWKSPRLFHLEFYLTLIRTPPEFLPGGLPVRFLVNFDPILIRIPSEINHIRIRTPPQSSLEAYSSVSVEIQSNSN